MPDITVIFAVTVTFLLAGMVKGVIDLGLPTVSLALLSALLMSYTLFSLGGVCLTIPLRHESWAGPLIGSANGVLTG